jgi:hypothetical protein
MAAPAREPVSVGAAVPSGGAGAPEAVAVSPVKPRTEPVIDPDDDPPVPAGATPLPAAAEGAAAVEVSFEPDAPVARLLPAIEAVTELLRAHPGSVPVVLDVPVAGARRQVRLPDGVAWDDRLADGVRRAAGLPVGVALRGDPAGS